MVQGTDEPLNPLDASLVLFEPVPSNTLDAIFKMKFASGKEYNMSVYTNRMSSAHLTFRKTFIASHNQHHALYWILYLQKVDQRPMRRDIIVA